VLLATMFELHVQISLSATWCYMIACSYLFASETRSA